MGWTVGFARDALVFANNVDNIAKLGVTAYCSLNRCEYQRDFVVPDVMAERRAVLAHLAQLCDATLLEALDRHF
jgi:hypothetical protein